MISILILTLNEESNLPQCLDSVKWSNDIVVLDSFSSDRTVDIAKSSGARVVQRKFDNWSSHQNWANANIPFKNERVFYLDADERMTEELKREVLAIAADPKDQRVAFYCGRRNYFMGQWIKRAYPPCFLMRFFRPGKVRFERLVNPTAVIDGPHGHLREMFIHYNFSKGLSEWFDKHNKYSELEALEGLRILEGEEPLLRDILSRDSAARRKAMKNLSFRLPFRPALRFLYMYILGLGFMDGVPGYHYCRLVAFYEFMIVMKMKEFTRRKSSLSI